MDIQDLMYKIYKTDQIKRNIPVEEQIHIYSDYYLNHGSVSFEEYINDILANKGISTTKQEFLASDYKDIEKMESMLDSYIYEENKKYPSELSNAIKEIKVEYFEDVGFVLDMEFDI